VSIGVFKQDLWAAAAMPAPDPRSLLVLINVLFLLDQMIYTTEKNSKESEALTLSLLLLRSVDVQLVLHSDTILSRGWWLVMKSGNRNSCSGKKQDIAWESLGLLRHDGGI
jgi:hypothetical protein